MKPECRMRSDLRRDECENNKLLDTLSSSSSCYLFCGPNFIYGNKEGRRCSIDLLCGLGKRGEELHTYSLFFHSSFFSPFLDRFMVPSGEFRLKCGFTQRGRRDVFFFISVRLLVQFYFTCVQLQKTILSHFVYFLSPHN